MPILKLSTILRQAASVLSALALGAGLVGGASGAEPLKATGLVVPCRKVELAASNDGVVTEVMAKEGDEVVEGQVLVKLDAAREVLEAEYARLVMEKRAADFTAADMLYKEQILSQDQWQERRMDAKLAETQYQLAQQRVATKSIKAPFAGLVVRVFKERGESVHSLERLADLVSLERVNVTLYLEPASLLRVKAGQSAQVTIPAGGSQVFTGTVETVDPVVDPSSGLFRVKVVVDNAERRIRTGTKADVVLLEPSSHAGSTH